MKVLGIDPDTQASGWAIIEDGPKVIKAGCVNTKHLKLRGLEAATQQGKKLAKLIDSLSSEVDAIIIESQQQYKMSYKNGVNPNNLITLAYVSGAAVGAAKDLELVRLVKPREWKGNVSKGATHRKIIGQLEGWSTPERIAKAAAVTEVDIDPSLGINIDVDGLLGGGPWSEIIDAIGLAMYGLVYFKAAQCK